VADLYRDQGCADRLLLYESAGLHRGFWGREQLARELRAERFDVAILLQNAFEAAWLAWRARIPERIGYARYGRSFLLTKSVPVPKSGEAPAHESYYYLELLRRAQLLNELPSLDAISLHVTAAAQEAAEQKLQASGSGAGAIRVAIAAGAAFGSAKCWLPERYAHLADSLAGDNCDVILFGAPAEREIAMMIEHSMRRRVINFAGATPIGELPALLKACQLFIGNDSGAMHVAAAVGLPIVGIFGPTNPDATRPLTPNFSLVREPVDCSPCLLRTCPIDHRCMTRISSAHVLEIARVQLSGRLPAAQNELRGARIG
jgi:heptosyltransferase II